MQSETVGLCKCSSPQQDEEVLEKVCQGKNSEQMNKRWPRKRRPAQSGSEEGRQPQKSEALEIQSRQDRDSDIFDKDSDAQHGAVVLE